jgi:phosphate transport system substrate-binding protein
MGAVVALATLAGVGGCAGQSDDTIKLSGSDTMVNLAEAWAEAFHDDHPDISLEVNGGGTGIGIAALCAGEVQIATASRPMKPKEIERATANNHGKVPKEFVVGRDALAIYVHRHNPIDTISMGELAEIYGEDGKLTNWKQLGVDNSECRSGEIIRVSRQNSSGTYAYFREAVLGKKREYKQGATSQSGSSDVVALVSHTPCAIGYSGMGYQNDEVKIIKVSSERGRAGIEPTLATALDGSYPISRPLYIYSLGEPTGVVQEFIQWILSRQGQEIVEENGYVSITRQSAN